VKEGSSDGPFIPPKTRAELSSPAPPGQRHEQMLKLVLPLLGAGLTPEAVFAQLRSMYASDVSDREIRDLIKSGIAKNPQPCGFRSKPSNYSAANFHQVIKPERVTAERAIANVEEWLGDFRCEEVDLWERSPWRPSDDWRLDGAMLIAALYDKDDFVNVVTDFTIEQQKDGKEKANPFGAGETLLRDDWIRSIRDHGVPQSKAGAWIRPNPVKEHGSGANGAFCDSDVTSYRRCLLESDELPLELQLSLWASLSLPVAAIIDTGGRSAHAWVDLNCDTLEEYRAMVSRIYIPLARFGLCLNNKNPSRLSRLPGAQREIGKRGDGAQRLLYLNPEPLEKAIFEKKK
jgi:hypothetical protein